MILRFATLFILFFSSATMAETKSITFTLKSGELSEKASLVFDLTDGHVISDAIVIRENGEVLQIAAALPDEGNTFPGETICEGALNKSLLRLEKVSFLDLVKSVKTKAKIVKLDLFGKSLVGYLNDVSYEDWSMVVDGKILCSK